jgi:hypothetical protein
MKDEHFPKDWSKGLIFPIFKGGPKEFQCNPSKYRGITLLSIVGKLYTSVLNERIMAWCERKGVLIEEQAGFRKNRSTSDQLFILTEIIKGRRPAKTYCCFIDIQKAYDRVWREGLWAKLYEYGFRGKMWRVLKKMYESVESSVLVGEERSEFFSIDVGLRQGCILSPILFLLFINGLGEEINKLGLGVKHGRSRVSLLMFADDIVLIAENKEDLEKIMQVTIEYSKKWRFSFNYDKCAVMVFGGQSAKVPMKYDKCTTTCTCGHHWRFGDALIIETCVYKYLGVELDRRLSFVDFKIRIAGKARQNRARIWRMGMNNGTLSVKACINMWETLVKSILEYGAEVWGEGQWEEGEIIQREMGRRILRCSDKTTNEAVIGELGWWTMRTRRNFIKLKYWLRIVLMDDDKLLKKIYQDSKKEYLNKWKNNWTATIHKILIKYNLEYLWKDETLVTSLEGVEREDVSINGIRKYWTQVIQKEIQKEEEREWREMMAKKEKLRSYITIKDKLTIEPYLLSEKNKQGRWLVTSVRTGANQLRIETGRWTKPKTKIEERLCMECMNGELEDEKHFILDCEMYDDLRERMFEQIRQKSEEKWKLEEESREVRWQVLMRGSEDNYCEEIWECVKEFVRKAMKRREKI